MNSTLLANQHANLFFTIAGIIALNLLFLFSTLIFSKGFKLRVSGASIVASLTLTWPSILLISPLLPTVVGNYWFSAEFMLVCVLIYGFWLLIFQPKSLQQMLNKKILQERKDEIINRKKLLKKQIKTYKSFPDTKENLKDLKGQLNECILSEKRIKRENGFWGLILKALDSFKKSK